MSADLLSRVRNGAWLDAQHFAPLEWAVPGVIPEGFGLVVGAPKLGKSWFVLGVGLAVACGGVALGKLPVKARPVLYAALEDGDRRLQDRCRRLLVDEPIPEAFEYVTAATPAEIVPLIAAWLDAHPCGLVMLDTLGRVMPPAAVGESAYSRDYRVGTVLKNLTDAHPGSTLLVVHHTRKGASEDWMDSTSGTQGLNGSADFTIALTRSRNEDTAVLKVSGRDVREGEYAMTSVDGSWRIDGTALADAARKAAADKALTGLGDDSAAVVAYIAEHPDGVTAAEVADRMGWPENKSRTYLGRLLDAGRIDRPRRGYYTPVASVASVAESNTSNTSNTPTTGEDW